jgi:uncharacterized protein (DUF58 family)
VSSTLASLSPTSSSTSLSGVQTNSITTQSAVSNIPATTTISPSSSPPNKAASLSTGAQAGIGVGAPVAAVLLIAVLFIFFRKKRKAHLRHSEEEIQEMSNDQKSTPSKLSPTVREIPAELTALAAPPHGGRSELSDDREVARELLAT